MKFIDKGFLVIVKLDKEDIQEINEKESSRLPASEILVGFIKDTGRFARIIPSTVRRDMVWERVVRFAQRALYQDYLKKPLPKEYA